MGPRPVNEPFIDAIFLLDREFRRCFNLLLSTAQGAMLRRAARFELLLKFPVTLQGQQFEFHA